MNRIDRLTGTLLMLQSQRRISVGSIASHWEISERTVYRDIAALCEAGVPIVFDHDVGYRLMGGYEVPPVMFSEEEALAVFLSGEIAEQVADVSLKRSIRTALLKIKSVLPEERQELLEDFKTSLGIWLHATTPDVGANCLLPIHNAVLQKQRMSLCYDTGGKGAIRERMVEPLGILYYGNHWHLIAYCCFREDYRDFRMDRVQSWEILNETFSEHKAFSLDAFVSSRETIEKQIPVTVTVSKNVTERFQRQVKMDGVKEERLSDGGLKIDFFCMNLDWVARWLIGYGTEVKVESPVELQDNIRSMAASIAGQYDDISKKTEKII